MVQGKQAIPKWITQLIKQRIGKVIFNPAGAGLGALASVPEAKAEDVGGCAAKSELVQQPFNHPQNDLL